MNENISCLFVEINGVYSGLVSDLWGIERDATNYNLNTKIIAHPPCQLWGRFAIINYKRWGGEHNMPKNDGGCFKFALDMVRKNGGVLEHPASTYAWDEYGIQKPKSVGWNYVSNNEYVCEVWQSAYGHLARKKTWLFYKGDKPHELNWLRKDGTHQIGGCHRKRGKARNRPTISGKKASATPILFAKELIKLAANS